MTSTKENDSPGIFIPQREVFNFGHAAVTTIGALYCGAIGFLWTTCGEINKSNTKEHQVIREELIAGDKKVKDELFSEMKDITSEQKEMGRDISSINAHIAGMNAMLDGINKSIALIQTKIP